MNMMDILQQTGGLDSLAQQLGVDQSTAAAGAAALLPAILGGFKKTGAAQPSGLEGLAGVLGGMGGGGLLDAVLGPQPTPVEQGNDILGQIFGSKDVSRQVATHAEGQSGVSADLLKKMLPILAMLVAGYLAKQSSGGQGGEGGLGGLLGGLLGGGQSAGGAAAPAGGLGGLANMLDFDGDGNPLDDIIGMAGKMAR